MELFLHAAVIWFVIGFILFLLEFVVPGLILFFFGLGAWVVSAVSMFTNLSMNSQLLIFLLSSILSILVLRKWAERRIYGKSNSSKQILEDELLGKTAIAETAISPGINGKVDFKGTSWQASSDDIISAGDSVVITGNESILLIVKSTKIR